MTIWRMRIACYIPNTTNTHSDYVTLIAFPLQHWLHESASMLCYTYIVCLVTHSFPRVTLLSLFSDKTLNAFFISQIRSSCSTPLILFYLIVQTRFSKATNYSTFIMQFSAVNAFSSLFSSNILLSSTTRKTQSPLL
jgi:hypothetical protein